MKRPNLTRQGIVETALELADEQGSDALSMRALARRLGVDPMAVYRHYANKAELLGAMCDATISELTPIEVDQPWDAQIRRLVGELRAVLVERPSLVPVMLSAPATPAATAVAQQAIAVLVRAGLEPDRAAGAFGAIFAYAMGSIAIEIADPPAAADEHSLRAATAALLVDDEPVHLDLAIGLMQAPAFADAGLDLLFDGVRGLMP